MKKPPIKKEEEKRSMAKNFFELSPTYMSRDGKVDRPSILATRGIIVGFLSDEYCLDKEDLSLIQAHLKRNGLPNSEGTIRNIGRMYRLLYLALNGDKKTIEYLNTIKKGLNWMKSPLDDLQKDGFSNWQSIEVCWQEREKERFCRGCQTKQSLARVLDDCTLCQEQLDRCRGQVEELLRERTKFSTERAAALKVREKNAELQKKVEQLLEEKAALKEKIDGFKEKEVLCEKILEIVGLSLQDFIFNNRQTPIVEEKENLTQPIPVDGKGEAFFKTSIFGMDFPAFSQRWSCRVEYSADFKKGLENFSLSKSNRKKIRRATFSLCRRGAGENGKPPVALSFETKKSPADSLCLEAANGVFIVFKKELSRLVFFEIIKK